jgi:hypothetical protein
VNTAAGYVRAAADNSTRVNRFFRRMQRFGKSWSARRSHGEMNARQTPPPPDPRTKGSGHGKKTADKWNQ